MKNPQVHNDRVTVTDFEHCAVHSDAGRDGLLFCCPDCGEEVIYAEFAWWDLECGCRSWTVEIKAIGTILTTEQP